MFCWSLSRARAKAVSPHEHALLYCTACERRAVTKRGGWQRQRRQKRYAKCEPRIQGGEKKGLPHGAGESVRQEQYEGRRRQAAAAVPGVGSSAQWHCSIGTGRLSSGNSTHWARRLTGGSVQKATRSLSLPQQRGEACGKNSAKAGEGRLVLYCTCERSIRP